MPDTFLRPSISTIVSILLLTGSLMIISGDMDTIFALNNDDPNMTRVSGETIWALSGDEMIENAAAVSYVGERMEGTGGRLGSYLWSGDLNGDGYDDIAMSAPHLDGALGVREGGLLYFFFGSDQFQSGIVDLETATPDLIIKGGAEDSKLLTSFGVGDIDNDGNLDIVLGIPSQPSAGRLYVLWGKGSWSGVIDLHDPGKLNPNGDPYGFLRNEDHFILAGHIAPVPWPESDYKIGQSVVVMDLDEDSFDDLVFSAPGWNNVNVIWGGPNRLTLGDEMTIIQDDQNSGLFGQSVISLDMDGNGRPDLAISGPLRNHPVTQYLQTGTVMVIFNAGDLRGSSNVNVGDGAVRPFIYGNDPFDNFGRVILSRDIDGDGRDDLIVGAPYSDGPDDTRYNSGSIHIFFGGQMNQFPQVMDSESGADILLYGALKESSAYPGDRLGTTFEIADMNGDGKFDLIIGYPDVSVPGAEKGGMVAYYPDRSVFSSPPRTIDMKDIDPVFRIYGVDMQDRLGYTLRTADIDGDGVHELMIGSPSSDGHDNTRPSCGEVHIIRGSMVSIDSFSLSGEGTADGNILCGKGNTTISILYSHSSDTDLIMSIDVGIPELGISMSMPLINGATPTIDAPYQMLLSRGQVSITKISGEAIASTKLEFTWAFPSGEYDLSVVLSSMYGNYTRVFLKAIVSHDVLRLPDPYDVIRNGERLVHRSVWFGTGDRVNVEDLALYYDTDPLIKVDDGPFIIEIMMNGILREVFEYDEDFTIDLTIECEGDTTIVVRATPLIASFPPGLPEANLPSIIGDMEIDIRVDSSDPDAPSNLVLDPGVRGYGNYSSESNWELRWEDGRSNGADVGSGIWAYEVHPKEGGPFLAMSDGGLVGTYYNDDEFMEPGLSTIDGSLDHNWGMFPPKPEIAPIGFSIRWHGWLKPPEDVRTRFTIWGKGGESLLAIDGLRILDWGDVEDRRVSRYLDLEEDELYYIEIYFRQNGDLENSFHFRWDDISGNAVELSPAVMYHASNYTSIDSGSTSSGPFNVSVRALDWVGLTSEFATAEGILDLAPPLLDLSRYMGWFNSSRVDIHFNIYDPSIDHLPGSGVDPESIGYRLQRSTETEFSDLIKDGIWVTDGETSSVSDVMMRIDLDDTWRGFIQISGADRVGNIVRSSSLSLGVDRTPPTFDLISPSIFIVHATASLSFALRVEDMLGSGVDGTSVAYRVRRNQTQWSGWIGVGRNATSEQLIVEFAHIFEDGTSFIQFMATDFVGNLGESREFEIRVKVPPVNLPPVPRISSPVNGSSYSQGHPVVLDGSTSTDDGIGVHTELRFTWSSNRTGFIGTGKILSVNTLTTGWHRITLFVDDGSPGHNISAYVDIFIMRIVDPNGTVPPTSNGTVDNWRTILFMILIAVVILVIALFIFIALKRYSKKEDEEIRIDYREETDDDLDYMIKSRSDDFGME